MAKKLRWIQFLSLFQHIYRRVCNFQLFSQFSPRGKCLEKDVSIVHQINTVGINNCLQLETKI